MDKDSLQNLENEVTCGICQEYYTEPKVLPCLHYYCKNCILQLATRTGKDKPFYCPECRDEAKLPKGGVDELKSAFFINRFKCHISALELTQGKVEVKCEACCSGDTAVSFCRQCAVFICNSCVEAHQRLSKMFEGHEVVSIQDLKEGKAKADITMKEPSPAKCHTHQELLKVYCFDCDLLICRDCTVKDHRDHNFEFSAVAAPKTKEDLLKKMEPLKTIVGSLSTVMKEVQTTKQEIQVQGDSVANTIHTSFNQLFQIMEVRKQEMLEEAAGLVRQKVKRLTVQEKNLALAVAEVQSVVDYTERCVNHCTDNEVMSIQADIRRRIQRETLEHNKSKKITQIVEQANMGVEVRCAEDLQQLCKTKANIIQITMCSVKGEGMKEAEVHKEVEAVLIVRYSNGKIANFKGQVTSQLKSVYDRSVIHCDVDRSGQGEYCIRYTPTVRGRHELTVLVDGQHVAGSPFPVFVYIHPTQLGEPVSVLDDLSKPSGISINSDGEILVAKKEDNPIVFYKDKKLVRRISKNQLKLTNYVFTSIPVDKDDCIYIASCSSNKIMKLNKEGTLLMNQLTVSNTLGHLFIAVINEKVMVCERGNKGTIKVYDRNLNYVRMIVTSCIGDLRGLAVDSTGNIYATDWHKLVVHVFSPQGNHLKSFGDDVLINPLGLCVAGEFVYVCDNGNHKIFVFTTEGKLVTKFGKYGVRKGEFNTPTAVCVDSDGFIYVCDTNNDRVQVF